MAPGRANGNTCTIYNTCEGGKQKKPGTGQVQVQVHGWLTVNGTCRAAARFCSARRCPRPWPPEVRKKDTHHARILPAHKWLITIRTTAVNIAVVIVRHLGTNKKAKRFRVLAVASAATSSRLSLSAAILRRASSKASAALISALLIAAMLRQQEAVDPRLRIERSSVSHSAIGIP